MQRKRFLYAITSLLLMFCAITSYAQTRTVTGSVTDEKTSQPIAGATVLIKGTNIATVTDGQGKYNINVPATAQFLEISIIGYATKTVATTADIVDIVLSPTTVSLENVVVVAYGTRKKSDLTGSVTAVSEKDFQKGNINSSEQLLQGKVAGLEVTTGGGAAGGGSKIRIRGSASLNASNDPLIVVDGVPVEGNGVSGSANLLNTINPNDIESMSVLKDASATALYGSRATNGVIIITTKKGTTSKPRFNFNTKGSVGTVAKYVAVLNADQVREIVNNDGKATYINMLGQSNTNWQKEIFQSALGLDNNFSVSGKAKITNDFSLPYRASAGYLTQQGVLKTNSFDRFTGALNLIPKFLNDHLSFNINAKYANTKNRFADEGAIGAAVNYDPTQSVISGNNRFGGYYEWLQSNGVLNGIASRNPVAMLELRNNRSTVNRFIGNVQMDYKMHFLPDLHLLVNLGMDRSEGSGTNILDSSAASSVLSYSGLGNKSIFKQIKKSQLADVQLFYQKNLGGGNAIDVLVGHGYQDFFTNDFNYSQTYLTGAVVPGTQPVDSLFRNGFAIESYLGRVNLTVANNYLLTASVRRDASSKFSQDNRVGYFPAMAFAWKIRDNFFKGSTLLSDLKLRLGWGSTGQQDGINYNYYLPLYYQANSTARYQFGSTFYYPYRPSAYNKDLKWETTTTTNIGLDFGFYRNRINGSIDYYQKKTKDLLSYVDIAPGANFDITQLRNIGSLQNKGVEIALNTVPVDQQKLRWEFGFNFTYNKSTITSLYNQEANPNFKGIEVGRIAGGTGNSIDIHAVGKTPYTFFPFKQVYDPSGKPIEGLYEDLNRDGVISDLDRYYYQKASPDFLFGMSTTFTLNKLSVGITGHGMAGNYLYNNYFSNAGVLRSIENPVLHIGNAPTNYLDTRFANNRYQSDYYIENASFFRLDNLNIGYDFGKVAKNKIGLRLNVSVQNLAVFTKYSGTDPENASVDGIDNNIYPRPRIFSIGANLDF